jgi:hypothetical protein
MFKGSFRNEVPKRVYYDELAECVEVGFGDHQNQIFDDRKSRMAVLRLGQCAG